MFEEKRGNRGLMASKLFEYDEYQNGNKRLQAFTNSSEYLKQQNSTSLTVEHLQSTVSQNGYIRNKLRKHRCYARLKETSRTNSTFGFCRHESQRKKTKRAVFYQRSIELYKYEYRINN
ncbi:MAG: hypothetical protein ACI91R_001931 [Vicingaceae bacterium]|jgi:hypothetical protein